MRRISEETMRKRAAFVTQKRETCAASVKRFGKYAIGYVDDYNWAWWDTTKENRELKYYPDFPTALRGLQARLLSDEAVRAGASLEKWLAGCKKLSETIERVLA